MNARCGDSGAAISTLPVSADDRADSDESGRVGVASVMSFSEAADAANVGALRRKQKMLRQRYGRGPTEK